MGWFWADAAPAAPGARMAPHPMPKGKMEPPPECPMHKKPTAPVIAEKTPQGACPYVPPENGSKDASEPPPRTGLLARLNPLNNMFSELSNERAEKQSQNLPLERETSTIPKGDGSLWEYPSPQQMYNAMLRKGYTDTDITAVESMVGVHNFLNEGAWAEIMGWERRFSRGLVEGYKICKKGEDVANFMLGTDENPFDTTTWDDKDIPPPKLLRFTGRPTEPTPKSQILQWLGRAFPDQYGTAPPFDRHDWFVERCNEKGCREIRYVIDYYEGPEEPTGEPVFFLDVRPAVDGPTSAAERLIRSGTDVWWRASGGVARELKKLEAAKKKQEEEAAARGRQYN
ncbi:cytochrome C1 heme lyase [Pyrenophora tritici-repentis]|uniref:Holocytochrome c-type synthase n=2 Tax=Pyrenophora tritici-repentis TaxID=45151 RepID=A0A2W1ERY3_9PLEO|nr:cytochrome C1 heme lyase [Pyrenophora tritici-repentis Pt-1C-BFP]KAA8615640.1 Cytochrome C1 heme lyase [Pyrenophora tritici-repentis]EDU51334.1 cytochrome C1 heme lyase [Pyrenophora tritici-repentis Pt-1C-BFP]KAF7443777.1 Cytochrome C1 heme lyase [Pyrenophora tritici-repentis]KAF7566499.1 cytochrome C1 heme lyase [Pyrenophora tritici-repentis]KAG9379513.1 Cytochrome C1 heme lyase [Pyrenophora tritici-repentis]